MVGEGAGAKPRGPMPPKKKRKDSTIVEKHGLSLAQQMEDRHEAAPPKRRAPKSRKGQQAEEVRCQDVCFFALPCPCDHNECNCQLSLFFFCVLDPAG